MIPPRYRLVLSFSSNEDLAMPIATRPIRLLILGSFLLLQTGCAVALGLGAAGAGAVAGYYYYNGAVYREYRASLGDTMTQLRSALIDQKFDIIQETGQVGSAAIFTKTANGSDVRITLEAVPSPIPAEGMMTRVSVRVGYTGDEITSKLILDSLSKRMPGTNFPGTAPPVVEERLTPTAVPPMPTAPTAPAIVATSGNSAHALPPQPLPVTNEPPLSNRPK